MDTPMNTPLNRPGSGPERTTRRRGTILGVTAGGLVGGLVGLAMTVPSFGSAASDDTTDAAASLVQQTDDTVADDTVADDIVADDTVTDDTVTDDTAGSELPRPDRGARLRESLQQLVDDGTITADQADAVAEHLAAQLPERGGHRGHRGPGMDGEVVAGLLGIEAEELHDALRDGQSIADLAAANGVDVQTVIDALVEEATGHLDLAVEDGRLTEAEAAEKAATLEERITARVNGERPARG